MAKTRNKKDLIKKWESIFDNPTLIAYEHLDMSPAQREFFHVPFNNVGTIKVRFKETTPMKVRKVNLNA